MHTQLTLLMTMKYMGMKKNDQIVLVSRKITAVFLWLMSNVMQIVCDNITARVQHCDTFKNSLQYEVFLSLKKSLGEEDEVSSFKKKLKGTGRGIRTLKKEGMRG